MRALESSFLIAGHEFMDFEQHNDPFISLNLACFLQYLHFPLQISHFTVFGECRILTNMMFSQIIQEHSFRPFLLRHPFLFLLLTIAEHDELQNFKFLVNVLQLRHLFILKMIKKNME